MNYLALLTIITLTFVVGCAKPESTQIPTVAELPETSTSSTSESPQEDKGPPENENRLSVGPISFIPPRGWEPRDSTKGTGIIIFAPDRPERERFLSRPSLSVKQVQHPGLSFEKYRELTEQLMTQSVNQMNALSDDPLVQVKEKGSYTLKEEQLDGVRVLFSTFSGVHQLPTGSMRTKTYRIHVLESKIVYFIGATFPVEFEEKMNAAWTAFVKDIQINK